MKAWKVVLIVSLCLALVFGVALIVLSIKKAYAVEHYENNYHEGLHGLFGAYDYYGCGKADCKYCNGRNEQFYHDFLYYRIIKGFLVASIVLTGTSGATAVLSIIVLSVKGKRKKEQSTES